MRSSASLPFSASPITVISSNGSRPSRSTCRAIGSSSTIRVFITRLLPLIKIHRFRSNLAIGRGAVAALDRVVRLDRVDRRGYGSLVIVFVLGGDGQPRPEPRQCVAGSVQGVDFRAFDIHLDE